MTNIALFRKIMIILLTVATVIVVVMVLKNSMQNGINVPSDTAVQEEQVEIKSTAELIAEKKFALIELSEEGFSENSYEVPLGGILEIRNNTERDIQFDIRAENFSGGLIVKAGGIGYSPIFTEVGKYTLSEFTDVAINKEISTQVNVVKNVVKNVIK